MSLRLDTPLAELLLARGLVGRPILSEALEYVRRHRQEDEELSLTLFLIERNLVAPDLLQRALQETRAAAPRSPIPSGLDEGARLGPYRLVRKLAEGGMGAVYEVEHSLTGGRYALKTLKNASGGPLAADAVERLRREARLSAALDHPQVVQIHAAEFEVEIPYLVQDLLAGGSLSERVGGRGVMAPEEAAHLVAQLAEGLAAAHEAGILHRDLKPDNVLFNEQGLPVLVDFGLSRKIGTNSIQLTQTGEILGTPAYMAPEQAMDSTEAREGADVYALGAILFFLLEGVPPFRGQSVLETLSMVLTQAPPTSEKAPPALAALLSRVLAKGPEERPSASELALLLRESVAPSAASSTYRLLLFPALLALCLLGGSLIWAALRGSAASDPRPTPTSTPSPTPSPSVRVVDLALEAEIETLAKRVRDGDRDLDASLAAAELLRRAPNHRVARQARKLVRSLLGKQLVAIPALPDRVSLGVGFLPGSRSIFGASTRHVGRLDLRAGRPSWERVLGEGRARFSRGLVIGSELWLTSPRLWGGVYSVPLSELGASQPRISIAAVGTNSGNRAFTAGLAISPDGNFLVRTQLDKVALYDFRTGALLSTHVIPRGDPRIEVQIRRITFLSDGRLAGVLNMRGKSPMTSGTMPVGGLLFLLGVQGERLIPLGGAAIDQAGTAFSFSSTGLYVGDDNGNLRRYPLAGFPTDPMARTSVAIALRHATKITASGAPAATRVCGVIYSADGTLISSLQLKEKPRHSEIGRWTPAEGGWTYKPLGRTPLAGWITLSSDRDLLLVEYHKTALIENLIGEVRFVGRVPIR